MSKIIFSGTHQPQEQLDRILSEEIEQRSITPESFNAMVFQESTDEPIFIESYFKGEVLRFGINPFSTEATPECISKEQSADSTDFSVQIEEKLKDLKVTGTMRNRCRTSLSIKPSSLEKIVLEKALLHLSETDHNTVICDILKRDEESGEVSKKINKESGEVLNEIEPHSIVLYKIPTSASESGSSSASAASSSASESGSNPAFQIFVIDPNNSEFSCHLSNPSFTSFTDSPKVKFPSKLITTPYKSPYRIYTPHKTPSGTKHFRDCIDIAVKLSIRLRTSEGFLKNIDEIKTNPVVLAITNNPRLNRDIKTFDEEKFIFRLRQISDQKYSKIFLKLYKKLEEVCDLLETMKDKLTKIKESKIKESAEKPTVNKIEELITVIDGNISKMIDYFIPQKKCPGLTGDALRDAYSRFVGELDIGIFLQFDPQDHSESGSAPADADATHADAADATQADAGGATQTPSASTSTSTSATLSGDHQDFFA